MNTDQASQFTGADFIGELTKRGIAISTDERGQWRDNVFVTRLCKGVKYEDICPKAYESVSEIRDGVSSYFDFYNARRPHRAHAGSTPDTVLLRNARGSSQGHLSLQQAMPNTSPAFEDAPNRGWIGEGHLLTPPSPERVLSMLETPPGAVAPARIRSGAAMQCLRPS